MRRACALRLAIGLGLAALVAPLGAWVSRARTGEPASKPAPPVTVQSLDRLEKQQYDWGWICWMMNGQIDPDAAMTFGVVEIRAHQRNPLHRHPNCEEILFVLSGSCEHRVGDRVDHLKPGDMIRIPAGVPHMAQTRDEPMRAVVVYSSPQRQFELLEKRPAEK